MGAATFGIAPCHAPRPGLQAGDRVTLLDATNVAVIAGSQVLRIVQAPSLLMTNKTGPLGTRYSPEKLPMSSAAEVCSGVSSGTGRGG